jgi:hypothetical protein
MNERDRTIRHGIPLADPDGLAKWRADAERQEEEFAQARRKREREERGAVATTDAARLRAELEAWRAKQTKVRQQEMAAVGEFIAECMDKVVDRFEEHSARMRNAIMDAIEARFTALEMQLRTAESRAKGAFQFAREKEDAGVIVDLPNPLRPRQLDS